MEKGEEATGDAATPGPNEASASAEEARKLSSDTPQGPSPDKRWEVRGSIVGAAVAAGIAGLASVLVAVIGLLDDDLQPPLAPIPSTSTTSSVAQTNTANLTSSSASMSDVAKTPVVGSGDAAGSDRRARLVNYDITIAPPTIEVEGEAEFGVKEVKVVLNDPESNSSWGGRTGVTDRLWSLSIRTSSLVQDPFEVLLYADDGSSEPALPGPVVTNFIGCDEMPDLPRCLPAGFSPPVVYVTDSSGRLILKP